jgi:arabinogalactan oligomer / maltooligosaccharide transport system substrate-binding protein
MRRGMAAAVLATAIVVSASACGSSGTSTSSSGKASGPVTITWWDTSDPTNEAPTYRTLVAEFEKANPSIKVDYVAVPYGTAETKFQTAAGSTGAPDVFRSDVGWTPAFAKAGYLAPLDGTPAMAQQSAFEATLIKQASYGGHIYGAPQVTDTLGLMYNKALLTRAGITTPPASWTQLRADAAQIKQKTGVNGFALEDAAYYAMPFLYGEGTGMVDPTTSKVTVDSAAAVQAVNTAKSFVGAPGVAKLDSTVNADTDIMDAFESGTVAMVVQGPWDITNVYAGSAFADKANLGVAPVPAGSTGTPGAPTGGDNLVAYAGQDAAHLAASEKFIAYLTSAASETLTALKNGTLPARTDAYTPAVNADAGIADYQAILKYSVPTPSLPVYGSLYTPFAVDYSKILTGQESVQAGLRNIAQAMAKLVAEQ